ncbi:hypothetical protein OUZ56_032680 [Daphnia magna]|uniref:Uncharacterized protein n=1 Tax=Daphnia magna TaxID=35525 RepID=A0ABQ9ZWT1_9CRUS|nr:hypothetical protein OUZ56_032680 [Daphnia magna]
MATSRNFSLKITSYEGGVKEPWLKCVLITSFGGPVLHVLMDSQPLHSTTLAAILEMVADLTDHTEEPNRTDLFLEDRNRSHQIVHFSDCGQSGTSPSRITGSYPDYNSTAVYYVTSGVELDHLLSVISLRLLLLTGASLAI